MAALAHDVVAIAHDVGNRRMEADAYQWAGCWAYALGEHRRAVDLLLKGVDARTTIDPSDEPTRRVGRSGYVAMFLAELGDFDEAQRAAEITMRARETIAGHPWNLVNASWQIASAYVLQGNLDRARPLADQAVALCRQWGYRRSQGIAMCVLGRILSLCGHATEAIEVIEEGLRRTDDVGLTWLRCPEESSLGEAYLAAGRLEEAASRPTEAIESARARGERGFEAWALRLGALVAIAADPPDIAGATERFREARDLASALEMRPLLAHCHLGLG